MRCPVSPSMIIPIEAVSKVMERATAFIPSIHKNNIILKVVFVKYFMQVSHTYKSFAFALRCSFLLTQDTQDMSTLVFIVPLICCGSLFPDLKSGAIDGYIVSEERGESQHETVETVESVETVEAKWEIRGDRTDRTEGIDGAGRTYRIHWTGRTVRTSRNPSPLRFVQGRLYPLPQRVERVSALTK